MAEQSLKDKTVKGTFWSAVDNVAQYAVSFIVSIVLARLLSPDDYGLIGIIAIFTAVCNAVISGGFSEALIRKKYASEEDYNTVFISNYAGEYGAALCREANATGGFGGNNSFIKNHAEIAG